MTSLAKFPPILHASGMCYCRCHAASAADVHQHAHAVTHRRYELGPVPPMTSTTMDGMALRTDAIDATVACPGCRDYHCPALVCELPELRDRRVRRAFAIAAERIATPAPNPYATPADDDEREVTGPDEPESTQG